MGGYGTSRCPSREQRLSLFLEMEYGRNKRKMAAITTAFMIVPVLLAAFWVRLATELGFWMVGLVGD